MIAGILSTRSSNPVKSGILGNHLNSWEETLRNTKNASNAKGHFKSKHANHPLAILAEQRTTLKAKDAVVTAEAATQAVLQCQKKNWCDYEYYCGVCVYVLCDSFQPVKEQLNVLLSKWLISQGLPYTVCASETFKTVTCKTVTCAATGNSSYPMLTRDMHNRLLDDNFYYFEIF
ncbi:Hypothetical protein PHPALM_6821 [Phytophthora palmivora]|uniref:Uncharacterized protein n=1 Tax=Phytophthora palmivora TaxID=4796 RepID=A0A2P4YDW6_9STRA|nr:Hypothetical protein PHPALM_6821 [Phytophthora palmivora]